MPVLRTHVLPIAARFRSAARRHAHAPKQIIIIIIIRIIIGLYLFFCRKEKAPASQYTHVTHAPTRGLSHDLQIIW